MASRNRWHASWPRNPIFQERNYIGTQRRKKLPIASHNQSEFEDIGLCGCFSWRGIGFVGGFFHGVVCRFLVFVLFGVFYFTVAGGELSADFVWIVLEW